MTVEKSIDLTATGANVEDAVEQAVRRAGLTLRGVSGFEVATIEGVVVDGEITYRVRVRVSFVVKEHVHE
jgi:flavin-binding protein dodecin